MSIDEISFEIDAISTESGDLIDLLGLKVGFPQEVISENNEVIKIETIEESTSTAVTETELVLDISIFPNPVHQNLFLSIENGVIGKVELFDPIGKKVFSASSQTNVIELDISQLSKGLYFIHLENNKYFQKKPFIKI